MSQQPGVIISQDLSGVGQVSLGVALPIIAAMGFNPYVLPTAVLSTHTGGLGQNTYTDLSATIAATLAHWQSLALTPTGLLLGYLGQAAAPVWHQALPQWQNIPLRVVDPVMADGGKLYHGFDESYVTLMRQLVAQATVITPNVTEAYLLLGEKQPPTLTEAAAQQLAQRLAQRFGVTVVVTGIPLTADTLGVAGAASHESSWLLTTPMRPGHFFGTGDLFASVLTGALLYNRPLKQAAQLATHFLDQAISHTLDAGFDPRFGLAYANALPQLLIQLKEGHAHAPH